MISADGTAPWPEMTSETSVILRRQVPVRFDETARSWFGGLPHMPRNVAWPRAKASGAALNFIAQICCSDLPGKIWAGRGPKTGWLLLFVDAAQLLDSDDGDLVQVLYIDKLGPERRPPGPGLLRLISRRLGPASKDQAAEASLPPVIYRRWPVDIVEQTIPCPPPAESDGTWSPWGTVGAELYGAAEDEDFNWDLSQTVPEPRSWRAVLKIVDQLISRYAVKERIDFRTKQQVTFCQALDQLSAIPPEWEPGWLEQAKAKAAANVARQQAGAEALQTWLDEHAAERATKSYARQQDRLAEMRRRFPSGERIVAELAQYAGAEGEAALACQIERDAKLHAAWVEKVRGLLARLRAHIVAQDFYTDMPETEWARLQAQMVAEQTKWWVGLQGNELRSSQRTLFDDALCWLGDVPRDNLLDAYTRSAASRAEIPAGQLAMLEPKLRHIVSVAHRMGGPRDVLQNSPAEAGDGDLLFQIGSDLAMDWLWADLGALFVYIDPAELRIRRFTRTHAWLTGG